MNNNKECDSKTVVKKKDTPNNKKEVVSNKFQKFCLDDFRKILNNIDVKHYDPDLDMIVECLQRLRVSITLCKGKELSYRDEVENGKDNCPNDLFQYHHEQAEYFFKILKQFRWFNELIEIDPRFNYPNNKLNKQNK